MRLMFAKNSIRLLLWTATVMTTSATTAVTAQQGYYDDRRGNYEPIISIYEDCDFKGQRRDIAVGEFRSMRELDFGNDKMSSIRVPRELEAIVYEHEQFKGDYARINRDVRCFDQSWNDEVSSLRVEYAQDVQNNRYGGEQNRDNRRNPVYGGDRRNTQDYGRAGNRSRNGSDARLSTSDLAQVVFDGRVLRKMGASTWQIADQRRGISQYREVSRDETQLFLKNEFNAERITVDLFNDTVFVVGPRGRQESHRITGKSAQSAGANRGAPETVRPAEPSRRINSECFSYVARTNGGSGGIRFVSKEGFHRFQEGGHRGRVCHNGNLVMEINKRDFNSEVVVDIQGRQFRFAAGEKEDRLENNWYRKNITLKVGR